MILRMMAQKNPSPYSSLQHLPTLYHDPIFVKPLEESYICPICRKALKVAMQTECGHRFCQSCIEKKFTGHSFIKCPVNDSDCEQLNLENGTVNPDFPVRKQILSKSVYCLGRKDGCDKTMRWKELENHWENECPHRKYPCENHAAGCQVQVKRVEQEKHKKECEYRLVACPGCGHPVPALLLQEHKKTECSHGDVECEYGCGAEKMRSEIANHKKTCPNRPKECSLKDIGCEYTGNEDGLKEHARQAGPEHIEKLHSVVTSLSKNEFESIKQENKQLKEKIFSLEERLNKQSAQQKENEELKAKLAQFDVIAKEFTEHKNFLSSLTETVKSHDYRLASAERKEGSRFGMPDQQQYENLERQVGLHDLKLSEMDLLLQLIQSASYDGELLWKIQGYARRKKDAINGKTLSLYSQPFYTSRHGYKLCARVYLNGDGIGKGNHVSLFFVIMRGDFDALLPWPFRQRVTLMLLDQESGRHLQDTFRPDLQSTSFQRPTTEMNIASGCPCFVSHEMLESGSRFLKDDTIFIKIRVDTSGVLPP